MLKIKNFIHYGALILIILTLIGEILFINYNLDNNPRFRTNFNLMFDYKAWGRDYAETIIEKKYKDKEISYIYEPAHINSKFDDDIIKPYLVTLYFLTNEKSITYIAWTSKSTYTIEWEVLKDVKD